MKKKKQKEFLILERACKTYLGTSEIVEVPSRIKLIQRNCFYYKKVKEVSMDDGVILLGESCFGECHCLEKVKLSKQILWIKDYVFFGCNKLKEIEISQNCQYIGNQVFSGCHALEKLVIPKKFEKDLKRMGLTDKQIEGIVFFSKNQPLDKEKIVKNKRWYRNYKKSRFL